MKVYKLFFKLLKAYKTQIILGLVLLLAIAIPVNSIYRNNLTSEFEVVDIDLGVVNQDSDHPVTSHFLGYLDERASLHELESSPETIADALYEQDVDYVVEIPEGFGDSLIEYSTQPQSLVKTEGLSDAAAFAEVLISGYLTNYQIISAGVEDLSNPNQLNDMLVTLESSFDGGVETYTEQSDISVNALAFGSSFTHYLAYIMIMTFISTFGYAILSMRDPQIEMRNRMSKMTETSRVFQLLIACLTFALVYWIVLIIIAGFIYSFDMLLSYHGRLLVISSFVCMLSVTAMSYFFVNIAPNKGLVSFYSTFISLFIAFTSGLFAPREFINDTLQQIASFAAPIWQVKANEIILSAQVLNESQLNDIYQFFGIQLLIGAAYFAASFVVQKYRQMNNIYNA